jgi:hypothetical protein
LSTIVRGLDSPAWHRERVEQRDQVAAGWWLQLVARTNQFPKIGEARSAVGGLGGACVRPSGLDSQLLCQFGFRALLLFGGSRVIVCRSDFIEGSC